ncbi:sulfur oxidation c-type cytochrome SoxX [Roseobacter sp.]|uniref:sulfur oxidation c-type cytochrome SoxX n=1 Tax=Roseobacter sp. TaxID=1907202 RepID=UPI0025F56571|nr:sulfur oxidation c-type cytochrome SoxX [Roseobacter sp.]
MIRFAIISASVVFGASLACAEGIAPQQVQFEDGAIAASLTGVAGDPVSGAELMNKGSGNCIACHAVTELEHLAFHGEIGPPLDGVADRWTEEELRGIVADAKQMFEGTMMPSFYKVSGFTRLGDDYTGDAHPGGEVTPLLTGQEIEDVVAYLMTLKEE